MLSTYTTVSKLAKPALYALLNRRLAKGKEDPQRVGERKGKASAPRPQGALFWVHAASIGEAQSALVLIRAILGRYPDCHCLVTTGTRTSAQLMAEKLPDRAFHQYYPLDHPKWVRRFLNHWHPDLCLWMESELWPNMLMEIQNRAIPAALVNARLSPRSFRKWNRYPQSIARILASFQLILAQTQTEAEYFEKLRAAKVVVSDNLKYSAKPLAYDAAQYKALKAVTQNRRIALYASTHKGEEDLACQVHGALKAKYPNILSIIVPRHPERGNDISLLCEDYGLDPVLRRDIRRLPDPDTDIYIVNTIGELGLFYALAPFAYIGRTFSDDGGGGHNPIEPALLGCAVVHGPHYQNLSDIFDEMDASGAASVIPAKHDMIAAIGALLGDDGMVEAMRDRARDFAVKKSCVIDTVMGALSPQLETALRV